MSDDALMDAATNNRRAALICIEQGHRGTPPGFFDVLADVPDDQVDVVVAEEHGNANYGNTGEARQACEELAYANELVRYGRPLLDFHTRPCAWALLLPMSWGYLRWRPTTSGVCVGISQRTSSYRAVWP